MAQLIKTNAEKIEIKPKNGKYFEDKEVEELLGGYSLCINLKDNRAMLANAIANQTEKNKLPLNKTASKIMGKIPMVNFWGMRVGENGLLGDVIVCDPSELPVCYRK